MMAYDADIANVAAGTLNWWCSVVDGLAGGLGCAHTHTHTGIHVYPLSALMIIQRFCCCCCWCCILYYFLWFCFTISRGAVASAAALNCNKCELQVATAYTRPRLNVCRQWWKCCWRLAAGVARAEECLHAWETAQCLQYSGAHSSFA